MALQYFEMYISHTYPFQVLTPTDLIFLKTGSPSTYDRNGACPSWLLVVTVIKQIDHVADLIVRPFFGGVSLSKPVFC